MPRSKKPDAPKFKPVFIAGLRPEIRSLVNSEAETKQMYAEDMSRIKSELGLAIVERLDALGKHLGVPEGNLFSLTLAIADRYVPGFVVPIGTRVKPGPKKIADRFKTVTEVELRKFERNLPSISAAIESVAAERRPAIRPPELSTKYFACLREIEANEKAAQLLNYWRRMLPRLDTEHLQFFDFMFWECERDCLGATTPHNVERLKTRKS